MEFATGISIDLLGVVLSALLPNLNGVTKTVEKFAKEKKFKNEVYRKFKRSDLYNEEVSDELFDEITSRCGDIEIVELGIYYTAMKTNKWISYAMWYMSEDDATLLKVDKDTREFINAITDMVGFGRIYENAGIACLNDYEITSSEKTEAPKFIFLMSDLKERLSDPEFVKKMKVRRDKMNFTRPLIGSDPQYIGNHYIDNDGMFHPVFFSSTPIIPAIGNKHGEGLTSEEFAAFDSILNPLIMDKEYSISRDTSGNIILTIVRDNSWGSTESFVLDDGTIMGGTRKSILGCYRTVNGNIEYIFVDIQEFPDIAFNILNKSFYQMNSSEVYSAYSNMLQNYSIYKYIDFSGTRWLDYLSPGDKQILTNNLTNIITYMQNDSENMFGVPRLRFDYFVDENNFGLKSDSDVKSTVQNYGLTSGTIRPGFCVEVTDGAITVYIK